MSDSFFAYISRMRYITRWSLMRNAMPENIQEHSHMCAVIAHALAVIRRDVFGRECDPNECAAVALYHDCSEILTGDLPTPIKYHNALIRDAYREVETAARTHDIVKAADKLSAYIKCIEERRAGNDEFISAEKQTRAALERCGMPEVEYFLEHFIPPFELTLDELGTLEENGGTADGTDKA